MKFERVWNLEVMRGKIVSFFSFYFMDIYKGCVVRFMEEWIDGDRFYEYLLNKEDNLFEFVLFCIKNV